METIKTGVLVIGGGGAAARAAFEARKSGAEVMLVTKGSFGAIGTRGAGATSSGFSPTGVFATPGWSGSLTQIETRAANMIVAPLERSYENILQAGLGMADPRLVRIIVEEAVANRNALLEIGAVFGEYGMRSHGVPIMAALVSQLRKTGVAIRERTMIFSLLIENGECLGAAGIEENSGDTVLIQAGATVLGTGGDSNLFMLNLNPSCNTGDGYVLGYEAGAELINLEFKQIFLGSIFPTRNMLTQALPPYVKLTNSRHEEFLQDYLPQGVSAQECLAQRQMHNPFSTRDKLSRYLDFAIIGEVKAGRGTEHSGIYLDRSDTRNPPLAKPISEYWQYRGIDFSRPVEVGICHHCSLGGFRINENAETTVPRLFAAGETAAGPHGADRMGGHMLLASQVFGARAGKKGATYARDRKVASIDKKTLAAAEERIAALRQREGNQTALEAKKFLQESAYFNLLTIRSKESLERFLDDVRKIKEGALPHRPSWIPNQVRNGDVSTKSAQALVEALELQNLLLLAEIEAKVCLARTESRGPHYREDFPFEDDNQWLKSITVKKANGSPRLDTIALDPAWRSKGDEKMGYWG